MAEVLSSRWDQVDPIYEAADDLLMDTSVLVDMRADRVPYAVDIPESKDVIGVQSAKFGALVEGGLSLSCGDNIELRPIAVCETRTTARDDYMGHLPAGHRWDQMEAFSPHTAPMSRSARVTRHSDFGAAHILRFPR